MNRALLSIGAAVVIAAAALPTSASAQRSHGFSRSAAPHVSMSAPRSAPRSMSSFVAQRSMSTAAPRARSVAAPRSLAAQSWNGGPHVRHFRRGPVIAYSAAPSYYGYTTPYYDDDECFIVRRVPTPWGFGYQRIYVCD